MRVYAMFVAEKDKPDLRVRLRPGLKEKLDDAIGAKKTSQQSAVNELVAWFVAQDGMLQSLILGQVDEQYRAQVARLILARMAGEDEPPAKIRSIPLERRPGGGRGTPEKSPDRSQNPADAGERRPRSK